MTQREACPNAQDVAAFAAAGLEPSRRAALEAHFETCAACATRVAALISGQGSYPEGGRKGPSDEDELKACDSPSYRLLRLLGTGGMGFVYEAEEVRTGRHVALKVAREVEGTTNAALRHRFFREARVAAFLEHANIVPVFDIGEFPDGAPYYTQRLIRGKSLGQVIAGCQSERERIALMPHFYALCEAIAYAHGRGVIHRDLKPANVIIGSAGETFVLDWGLARLRPSARSAAQAPAAPHSAAKLPSAQAPATLPFAALPAASAPPEDRVWFSS